MTQHHIPGTDRHREEIYMLSGGRLMNFHNVNTAMEPAPRSRNTFSESLVTAPSGL